MTPQEPHRPSNSNGPNNTSNITPFEYPVTIEDVDSLLKNLSNRQTPPKREIDLWLDFRLSLMAEAETAELELLVTNT